MQEHRRPETLSLSLDVSSLHVCFGENSLVSLNFSSHLREQMNIQGFFFLKKKKSLPVCVCVHAQMHAPACLQECGPCAVVTGLSLGGLPLFPGLR